MGTEQNQDQSSVRLVISRGHGEDVLLEGTDARFRLPSFEVPRCERLSEFLTSEAKKLWGQQLICLFTPPMDCCEGERTRSRYCVMEYLGNSTTWGSALKWVPFPSLPSIPFTEPFERQVIQQAIASWTNYSQGFAPGPFAKPNWFQELRAWSKGPVGTLGYRLTGRFRQFNAGPSFTLIRFESSGPAVWFKAVGESKRSEFDVTLSIARLAPDFVPRVVAVRPEWNGWLALESEGRRLRDTESLECWESAAMGLAELQLALIGKQNLFLALGAHDLRLKTLFEAVNGFIGVAAELMEQQAKSCPPPVRQSEVQILGEQITDALSKLQDVGLPEPLGHLDLNPDNILVSTGGCIFLDWAEAYVGHPFFSLSYLLEHFRRRPGSDDSAATLISKAYRKPWGRFLSPNTVNDALTYAPLIAVFAYALAVVREGFANESARGYLRALVRRMKKEADLLAGRRLLCAS